MLHQCDQFNVRLLGFAHSHPGGASRPSAGDMEYAKKILQVNEDQEFFFLPIIGSEAETGRFQVAAFAAKRDGKKVQVEHVKLEVVDDRELTPSDSTGGAATAPIAWPGRDLQQTFDRVRTAYDVGRLATSRLVVVGCGGAAGFLDEMARSGVGEFVLIDPDVIEEANLATQTCFRSEIGMPKVEAMKRRIEDINPEAIVKAKQTSLNDLDDPAMRDLLHSPLREWDETVGSVWGIPELSVSARLRIDPQVTLLCGFTDAFEAQARINRLALKFAVPSLCAQVYAEGRGAEVTFTHPDATPACHRCALRSRYEAFAQGYRNTVGSAGTPIFATSRLNSLKGMVAMALLHRGTGHPRWGDLLERIGNRNLIQVRLDPDLQLPVFQRVFEGGDGERILCDETVWLPQEADNPETGFAHCPDCGGAGRLRDAEGRFADTRELWSNGDDADQQTAGSH